MAVARPAPLDWALMILMVAIGAVSFVSIKIGLRSFGPYWLSAARLIIATAFMFALTRGEGAQMPKGRDWAILILLGLVAQTLPVTLNAWASQHVPAFVVGLAMATSPLFIAAMSFVLLRNERPTPIAAAGLLVGFCGCAIIILGRPMSPGGGGLSDSLWPYVALGGSVAAISLSIVVARRASHLTPVTKTLGALVFATLFSTVFAFASEPLPQTVSVESWLALLYMGIMPTGVAGLVTYVMLDRTSTRFVSLSNYLMPVGTMVLGAIVLAEIVTLPQFLGIAVILAGIAMSEWPQKRAAAPPARIDAGTRSPDI